MLEVQSRCSEVQDIVHVSIASLRESLNLLENRLQHETKKVCKHENQLNNCYSSLFSFRAC